MKTNLALWLGAAWIQVCLPATSSAQDYPSRPIRLIVAQSPGTVPDSVARILGPEMSRYLGQPIVVENKPGADSIIGFEYVAKMVPADGYTLASVNVESLAILPYTSKGLRFNPLPDLPPFIGVIEGRYIFGSASKLQWKTLNELVAYARENPGKLNYGSSSPIARLSTVAVVRGLKLDVVHVPFSAAAPFYQALIAGDIHMGFAVGTQAVTFGDKFRPLAVTGAKRSATMPEVPTFAELGLPQVRGISFSLNVTGGTAKPIVDKLHAAGAAALKQQEVAARFAKIGFDVVDQNSEAATKSLKEALATFADLTRKAGISAD